MTALSAEIDRPQSLVSNVLQLGADPEGKQDASEAFQKALDNGGVIEVPSGAYLLRKTLLLTRPGTCLSGRPGAVLSFPGGFLDSGLVAKAEPFGLTNIVIRNLTLICDKANYTPGKDGKYAYGISLFGVDGAVVEGCAVNGFNFTGIGVTASQNVRVRQCTTSGGRHGMSVNGHIGNPKAGGQPYGCRNISITDCHITQTWDTFIAIGLCASDVTVSGCFCEGSAAHGIDIFNSDNVIVTGNHISNWMDPRVLSPYCEQAVGVFVHCDWGVSVKIPTRNIVISGNVLVRDPHPDNVRPIGIGFAGTVEGATVTGNIVRGGLVGCSISEVKGDQTNCAPQAVALTGNVFQGQGQSLYISGEAAMSVLFTANTFAPSDGKGMAAFVDKKTKGVGFTGNVGPKDRLPEQMGCCGSQASP